MAKTLADARTYVRVRLGDTAKTVWTTDTEIDFFINEGYRDFCGQGLILWRTATPAGLDDVAGTATYTLPSDTFKVERVTWKDKVIHPMYAAEEIHFNPNFETERGDVVAYMLDGDGIGVMRKVQVPSASQASTTRLEDYYMPPLLVNGTDPFLLPDRLMKYVCWFAIARAFQHDGPGQSTKAAGIYRGRYVMGLQRLAARKLAFLALRDRQMGGQVHGRAGTPPEPRLPWNYGRVVYPRRRR